MNSPYSKEHEREMIIFYNSLSDKNRQRYAVVEVKKLGLDGIDYICSLFDCDDRVRQEIREIISDSK